MGYILLVKENSIINTLCDKMKKFRRDDFFVLVLISTKYFKFKHPQTKKADYATSKLTFILAVKNKSVVIFKRYRTSINNK